MFIFISPDIDSSMNIEPKAGGGILSTQAVLEYELPLFFQVNHTLNATDYTFTGYVTNRN